MRKLRRNYEKITKKKKNYVKEKKKIAIHSCFLMASMIKESWL